MKKKWFNFTICLITIFILIQIFNYTDLVIETIYQGSIIWFKNILPTLLPFFIISDILSNYHFMDYISKTLGNIMHLFKLPKETASVLFMSLFSGFPSSSKFIKELLDDKIINEQEATKLLTFTHFSNPLFIIGTIGVMFLKNKRIGIIILIIHFTTNLIIGLLFRNIYFLQEKNYKIKERKTISFIEVLKKSIVSAINTLFLVYGILIFFMIITTIINNIFILPPVYQALLNGLIEVTQGLKLLSTLNIDITIKATFSTFLISFGGISIHMQAMSILSDYKINYYIYLLSRIIHACISSITVYFVLTYY